MEPKTVIIKKYENRRLYDTNRSRYVNLDEVAQLIREGNDVQVVDAITGEDLTRLVLTQIIVEHAKASGSAFPLDVLRQMVLASGKATQDNSVKYMRAVFDLYQNAYRAIAPPLSPFEFMRVPSVSVAPGPEPVRPAEPSSTPMEAKNNEAREVKELRRRLAELESMVSKLSTQKRTKRKARALR
jgi:polyhydroxyalkanoate synthesis repressor PhaR